MANLWPPFLGAGVSVRRISPDWRHVVVELRLRWYNRNYVGSHFGGNLFTMTDPFLMLMLIRNLGLEYVVWDMASTIEFLKPARGTVRAEFEIDENRLRGILDAIAGGARHHEEFSTDILDSSGTVVARVRKTVYIRRKNPDR